MRGEFEKIGAKTPQFWGCEREGRRQIFRVDFTGGSKDRIATLKMRTFGAIISLFVFYNLIYLAF